MLHPTMPALLPTHGLTLRAGTAGVALRYGLWTMKYTDLIFRLINLIFLSEKSIYQSKNQLGLDVHQIITKTSNAKKFFNKLKWFNLNGLMQTICRH